MTIASIPDGHVTISALRDLGLNDQTVHRWTDKGWLRAATSHPGTGRIRTWPADEVVRVAMARQ